MLVDEWPERIPSTQEQAAVAFHYEEPKARAPQALLLAVCPDNRAFWDEELVTGILQETCELMKIRTVDLDSVQQVGQILGQKLPVFTVFELDYAITHTPKLTNLKVHSGFFYCFDWYSAQLAG